MQPNPITSLKELLKLSLGRVHTLMCSSSHVMLHMISRQML